MTTCTSGTAMQAAPASARLPFTVDSVMKTARAVVTTVATTTQHTLTAFGLTAVAVVGVLYANPDMARNVSQMLAPTAQSVPVPAATPVVAVAPPVHALMDKPAVAAASPLAASPLDMQLTADERKMLGNEKQQRYVTAWLSKRYRVASDATNMLVSTAYLTAREMKIDPLLILAVMAIESGLNPFAESPVGAQGLMQVMSKVHHDKFREMGGTKAALNPVANIRVGAQILKEYVTRGGSVEAGLKRYVGAAAFDTDSGYGSRVLAEYQRLKLVASGQKVPTFNRPVRSTTMVADKREPAAPTAPTVPEVPKVDVESPMVSVSTDPIASL